MGIESDMNRIRDIKGKVIWWALVTSFVAQPILYIYWCHLIIGLVSWIKIISLGIRVNLYLFYILLVLTIGLVYLYPQLRYENLIFLYRKYTMGYTKSINFLSRIDKNQWLDMCNMNMIRKSGMLCLRLAQPHWW